MRRMEEAPGGEGGGEVSSELRSAKPGPDCVSRLKEPEIRTGGWKCSGEHCESERVAGILRFNWQQERPIVVPDGPQFCIMPQQQFGCIADCAGSAQA